MPNPPGSTGTGVLLVKNNLLLDRRAFAAPGLGPANTGPATRCKTFFPSLSFLNKHMLIARAASMAN